MEVVVLTHKGGQRSDGNVSDSFVCGEGSPACATAASARVGALS